MDRGLALGMTSRNHVMWSPPKTIRRHLSSVARVYVRTCQAIGPHHI